MQDNNLSTSLYIPTSEKTAVQTPIEDYSLLLTKYGADYHKVEYYWQVGETAKVQGWIIHLSVIAPQLADLLHHLIPILLTDKIVFKLPKDRTTARNILDGNVGYEQLGKVISIYPENEKEALGLAKQLVQLTTAYRGPVVPTDIHLGGIVYVGYGGINPIMRQGIDGQMESYIYNVRGELIKDINPIPFRLPSGVVWPFSELASPESLRTGKNIRNIYRPIAVLKPDPRGNVTKALYLKGFIRVGTCVIKAGRKNMLADDMGRDIQDRLAWQRDLHNELRGIVRLPKIIDFFEENGEIHLVMEFIKGQSLHDNLVDIHGNQRSWFQLTIPEQMVILNWLIKILTVIDVLHNKGFVHRDIAPGNFIIDAQGEIVLIDTELAYDLKKGSRELPFELGTPGFMSPEQEAISIPTFQEDIYGLGALMINCFTCLSASRFNAKDPGSLFQNLVYFVRDSEIAALICRCLGRLPSERPDLHHIKNTLEEYKRKLQSHITNSPKENSDVICNPETLQIIINQALRGLGKEPMPVSDGLWLSKTMRTDGKPGATHKDFSPYGGLHTGMTGVLYLLARAKKLSYELGSNKQGYKQCWKYINHEYLQNQENLMPGLYNGAAGIALTFAEGLDAGLLEDSELLRNHIQRCLEKPNELLNVAEGCAGQGIALLQCEPYLPGDISKKLLDRYVLQILSCQKKDGSWNSVSPNSGKSYTMSISWSQGITGIIYFLMAYYSRYENKQVFSALNKGLAYLLKRTNELKGLFNAAIYQKMLDNRPEIGDERTSSILCFIKAYQLLKDPSFKKMAEWALYQYPDFVVSSNFGQDGGMAALGEIYWEASRSFDNQDWEKRALQIASVFLHTSVKKNQESCYWFTDETFNPIADLYGGNSGIIHFLLRCINPDKLGHILIN